MSVRAGQYVSVRVDTTGLFQPVSMAQGIVGVIGRAVPTSFEMRNPELFTRPLTGARTEPYEQVVRVMPIDTANRPLGSEGKPLGGTGGTAEGSTPLVDSLGRDDKGNPKKVPGLKIDNKGNFVGDDGKTPVEVDTATNRPRKYNGTLYELAFGWYPTAEKLNSSRLGVPVDGKDRPIENTLLDSDGKFTSLDGATPYPVDPFSGLPVKPGSGNDPGKPIESLDVGLSELAKSINLALVNGAVSVWAFRLDRAGGKPTRQDAFNDLGNKQINIVCLSKATDKDSITALKNHVEQASPNDAGGGGTRPRIGVAMLPKGGWNDGVGKPSQKLSDFGINWSSSRMVLVAHKSDDDVATAVAGTIARYDPWISLVMKEVNGISQVDSFTDSELAVWVDPEANGIVQPRVNPIIDPPFLAGSGLVMGECYTADGTGQRLYIDVVRTIDDLAFMLKENLTNPNVIGTMRINRTGLIGLRTVVSALLDSRVSLGEIDSYAIDIPLLGILEKDPAQRTPSENQQVNSVQNSRQLPFSVSVDYAGAIHYLAVTLKFV